MTRQEQDYYNDISKQTGYLKRIAQALEEHTEYMEQIVNKEKNDRLDGFKKAANLLYGNDATVKPEKGRSDENYTYPQFVKKFYANEQYQKATEEYAKAVQNGDDIEEATKVYSKAIGISMEAAAKEEQPTLDLESPLEIPTTKGFQPNIESELDERIHKESQSITGGEFSDWYNGLTLEEVESYRRIYGH